MNMEYNHTREKMYGPHIILELAWEFRNVLSALYAYSCISFLIVHSQLKLTYVRTYAVVIFFTAKDAMIQFCPTLNIRLSALD
jgi:hypothetical protein